RDRPVQRLAPPAPRAPRLDRRSPPAAERLMGGSPMSTSIPLATLAPVAGAGEWCPCRFLTCSVLPVRMACNLTCPFCFSKSSVSSLAADRAKCSRLDAENSYAFARERGATRLVITGGGEPLLRADDVVDLIARGRRFFS